MKIKNIYSMALLMGAMAFTGCQNSFDDPGLAVPEATLEANMTIADFKELSWTSNAQQLSADNHPGIVIKGRVISSDATGNIYQSLVIQDETAAIPITIRRASLFNEYHLGQELVINTEGLWLGKYNGLIQLGWLGEPYNGEEQLTFMSFAEFETHAQPNGLPDPKCVKILPGEQKPADSMYCQVLDIDQLPTAGEDMYNLQGQLVEFRNVSFEGGGELTFAPYQENANRYIKAQNGSLKLTVRNSGYATFYNNVLPKGEGTVRGILSWYGDGTSSTDGVVGGWQLLLRSLDDLDFDTKGSYEDPYTITEAREHQNQQLNGWVEGYVVGSVKAGVSQLAGIDDIIFGADAEMDNNLVIATSAEGRDLDQMLVVELPQGSIMRQYLNLKDNPAVLGRVLTVRGNLAGYLGFAGVLSVGTSDDFTLDHAHVGGSSNPGGGNVTAGNGTEASPYSVAQAMTVADQTGVWVVGYVVGYNSNMTWPDDNVFGNTPSDGNNWVNGTNIILSDSPVGAATANNSIPVALTANVRPVLAISKNPDIYGKKVMVKGNIMAYFKVRGLKAVDDYKIL